jgi:transposase-like protein
VLVDSEILLWIAGGMFVFLMVGYAYREVTCPSCGKFFSKVVDKKEDIGRRYENVSVERQVKKNDGADPPNFETRVKEYELTFTKYLKHYRCKSCADTWTEQTESQTGKRFLSEHTRLY